MDDTQGTTTDAPPAAPEAPPPTPADPAVEQLREDLRKLEKPWHLGIRTLFFAASLALFAWSMRDRGVTGIAILAGVLLFHELGHYAAMRAFGYRDLKVFFIPFFGAAVSGRPQDPKAWQSGLVSLAGPVPGLLLGAALVPWAAHAPGGWAPTLVITLVAVNAFNLLPVLPLDGGRLMGGVLFSRHPLLELGAMVAGAVTLAWQLGFSGSGYVLPGLLGGMVVARANFLQKVHPMRARAPDLAGPTSGLPDDTLLWLLGAADELQRGQAFVTRRGRASMVATVHEALQQRPAGLRDSAVLLGAWGAACAVGLLAWGAYEQPAPDWRPVQAADGHWTAEFPATPAGRALPGGPGTREAFTQAATLRKNGRFESLDLVLEAPADFFETNRAMATKALHDSVEQATKLGQGRLVASEPVVRSGAQALRVKWQATNGTEIEALYLAHANHVHVLYAYDAPDPGDRRHFLDSFALTGVAAVAPAAAVVGE